MSEEEIYICPICGGDRSEKRPQELFDLMKRHGFRGESMNPGGRLLIFEKTKIQLSDMCNACDTKHILEHLRRIEEASE